ncbi:MAG TPA: sulfatase-like hydrolase/transferase, partial [Myxococcaceae bacterium]|nr:sulfatase-like hydrolase/transferase [Myxococcaceae bacterium]
LARLDAVIEPGQRTSRDGEEAGGISRRRVTGFLGAAGAAAIAGLSPSWSAAKPRRSPNLLVILADDLGWADLSCYGAPTIRTPNLDRLAASGARFTQGYAASSVCSPTRFGLYTGRYPGRLAGGLPEPIPGPTEIDGIPLDHPTLASLLKREGYRTAMIGKWHCGYLPWFSPTRVGWDEFFGNFGGAVDYFSKIDGDGRYDLYEGEVEYQDLRYYTEILTEKAALFIRQRTSDRWLLNLNFTTPHWPWEGPGDKAVSADLTARIKAGERRAIFHTDGGSIQTYQAMVEDLDRAIGKVVSALGRSGQLEETVIFFASDNGGERFSYNWPLSGKKGDVLEGGIRVPTLVSWPGRIRGHQVDHEPVVTMDWTATFLELAGARPEPRYPLDGLSLVDHLLHGTPLPRRDLFWRMRDQRALRRGSLKYVRLKKGDDHLYDLAADVHEQADLARRRPEELAQLGAAWEAINGGLLPYRA